MSTIGRVRHPSWLSALSAAIACGSLIAAVLLAEPQALDIPALRDRARKIVEDGAAPSVVIAVARDGRLIWSEGFGFADRESKIAATPQTPYSVASLTKPFTATAVMVLAERQRIALDQPLERYLGPLKRPGATAADVTVRRVLGHAGGFPQHYQYFFDDQPRRPLSFAETMRCYGAQYLPVDRYTYSNLGYGALGELVARVFGLSYRDFLAQEIFKPLGLVQSRVPERAEETAGAAKRYARDGSLLPFFVTDFPGGSALYASVEDLVRFGSFHAGALMTGQRPVLTAASLAEMHRVGAGDYGLGWSVNPTWGRYPVVWHSGAFPGASAALWTVPAQKIAIAVIANQIGAPVNQLAGEILAALAGPPSPSGGPASTRPSPPAASAAPATIQPGRYRGVLMDCPTPEELTLDVRGPGAVTVTLSAGSKEAENVAIDEGTLTGTFHRAVGAREADYRFYLRARDNRLEGPVTRRISLGPRANEFVTLWAELERSR
jgi:CubicO group peptidase (beta-lactamase class C family)